MLCLIGLKQCSQNVESIPFWRAWIRIRIDQGRDLFEIGLVIFLGINRSDVHFSSVPVRSYPRFLSRWERSLQYRALKSRTPTEGGADSLHAEPSSRGVRAGRPQTSENTSTEINGRQLPAHSACPHPPYFSPIFQISSLTNTRNASGRSTSQCAPCLSTSMIGSR